MRRLQAIALVIALMFAPTALFAEAWRCACAPDYCTMARCPHGKCLMMQHEHRRGSSPTVQCNCMRFPVFGTLAPLTEMILTRPAPRAGMMRVASETPAEPLAVLPGFLPSPFHPPRD